MATFSASCSRPIYKRVPVQGGPGVSGFTSVPDGREHAEITIEINVKALIDMLGPRAMSNKAGRSKIAGGFITAYATNLRRV